MHGGFQGDLNWAPKMPRDASPLGDCCRKSKFGKFCRFLFNGTRREIVFWLLSNWMVYARSGSFLFDYEPNGIALGSSSKGKLSLRSYYFQFESDQKYWNLVERKVSCHCCQPWTFLLANLTTSQGSLHLPVLFSLYPSLISFSFLTVFLSVSSLASLPYLPCCHGTTTIIGFPKCLRRE